jgi:hypothetical protein
MPSTTHPEWLVRLASRGFHLVFYPPKQKGPDGPDAKNWTTKVYSLDDYRQGMNVGCKLGVEVTQGRFLVDIDFDWTDGVVLARRILPPTGFGFGRQSRKISHAFYTVGSPLKSRSFRNIDGKPFVELRGTKADGSIGLQTMLPPSIHPTEEQVELRVDEDIPHFDEAAWFERRVVLYAVGCMFYFHLGPRGLLHDVRLALAGFLLSVGLSEDEVLLVTEAVAEATGNNVDDMRLAVRSTAVRFKANEKVAGASALMKALGDEGKKILTLVREWLGANDFVRNKQDAVARDSQSNMRMALEKLGVVFSWNEFSHRPLITMDGVTETLEDHHVDSLWFRIETRFGWRPERDAYRALIKVMARENPFHPVREYLKALTWDGTPRVDTWLSTYGGAADNDYTRAVGRITLLAAVRRVFYPGSKFDEMLVLEGEQGAFKSTAIAALCPNDEWFTDDLPLDVDSKEVMERTGGKWIIEAAELSGMRASQREHLKAMLSRQQDGPARMAYAEMPTTRKRQFILIGTTNDHSYLNDPTGNRRFWPVRTEGFKIDDIRRDRDQLWAEAVVREKKGESTRLPESLYPVASIQQERRREMDPWEQTIRDVYTVEYQRIPPNDLWELLGIPVERRTHQAQARISKIMQALSFRKMTVQDFNQDGKRVQGWGRGSAEKAQQSLLDEDKK